MAWRMGEDLVLSQSFSNASAMQQSYFGNRRIILNALYGTEGNLFPALLSQFHAQENLSISKHRQPKRRASSIIVTIFERSYLWEAYASTSLIPCLGNAVIPLRYPRQGYFLVGGMLIRYIQHYPEIIIFTIDKCVTA